MAVRTACCLAAAILASIAAPVGAQSLSSPPHPDWASRFVQRRDLAYGTDPRQTLDLYLQGRAVGEPTWYTVDTTSRPTLIWIHGGGWLNGDKADEIQPFLRFVERGWNVASLNYRMGRGTAPQAGEDVICAVHWLVSSSRRYGIDPKRIVIGGGSAGAHLALVAALEAPRRASACGSAADLEVRAIVNFFGPTDFAALDAFAQETGQTRNALYLWAGGREKVAALHQDWSPIRLLRADGPPVFTVHGARDVVVPRAQSDSLHAALRRLGVTEELLVLPSGNHGGFGEEGTRVLWTRLFAFLDSLRP